MWYLELLQLLIAKMTPADQENVLKSIKRIDNILLIKADSAQLFLEIRLGVICQLLQHYSNQKLTPIAFIDTYFSLSLIYFKKVHDSAVWNKKFYSYFLNTSRFNELCGKLFNYKKTLPKINDTIHISQHTRELRSLLHYLANAKNTLLKKKIEQNKHRETKIKENEKIRKEIKKNEQRKKALDSQKNSITNHEEEKKQIEKVLQEKKDSIAKREEEAHKKREQVLQPLKNSITKLEKEITQPLEKVTNALKQNSEIPDARHYPGLMQEIVQYVLTPSEYRTEIYASREIIKNYYPTVIGLINYMLLEDSLEDFSPLILYIYSPVYTFIFLENLVTTAINKQEGITLRKVGYTLDINVIFLLKTILQHPKSSFIINDLLKSFVQDNSQPLESELIDYLRILQFFFAFVDSNQLSTSEFSTHVAAILATFNSENLQELDEAARRNLFSYHLLTCVMLQRTTIDFLTNCLPQFVNMAAVYKQDGLSSLVQEGEFLTHFFSLQTIFKSTSTTHDLGQCLENEYRNYGSSLNNLTSTMAAIISDINKEKPPKEAELMLYFANASECHNECLTVFTAQFQTLIITWVLQQTDKDEALCFLFEACKPLKQEPHVASLLESLNLIEQLLKLSKEPETTTIIQEELRNYCAALKQKTAVKAAESKLVLRCMQRMLVATDREQFFTITPELLNKSPFLYASIEQAKFFINLQSLLGTWKIPLSLPGPSTAKVLQPVIISHIEAYLTSKQAVDGELFAAKLAKELLWATRLDKTGNHALVMRELRQSLEEITPQSQLLPYLIKYIKAFEEVFMFLHQLTALEAYGSDAKEWFTILEKIVYKMIEDFCKHPNNPDFFIENAHYYFADLFLEKARLIFPIPATFSSKDSLPIPTSTQKKQLIQSLVNLNRMILQLEMAGKKRKGEDLLLASLKEQVTILLDKDSFAHCNSPLYTLFHRAIRVQKVNIENNANKENTPGKPV